MVQPSPESWHIAVPDTAQTKEHEQILSPCQEIGGENEKTKEKQRHTKRIPIALKAGKQGSQRIGKRVLKASVVTTFPVSAKKPSVGPCHQ